MTVIKIINKNLNNQKVIYNYYFLMLKLTCVFNVLDSANSVMNEKSRLLHNGMKQKKNIYFTLVDIKYLSEKTNNFQNKDMFEPKFLTFLIKDRFKDFTERQLLNKLRKLYEKNLKISSLTQ